MRQAPDSQPAGEHMNSTSIGDINLSGNKSVDWLKGKEYPYSDQIALRVSTEHYDGGQYGVGIPVINSLVVGVL